MRLRKSAWAMALVSVLVSVLVSGCGAGSSRIWVPQGSGEVAQPREEPVARAPAPRRPAPAVAQAEQAPAVSPFRAQPPGMEAPAPRASAPASAPPAGGYTQATRYGDLLFVSGQIALDTRTSQFVGDKIEDQTRQVLENIRQILEANRLTMANVVSATVYMKDITQFRAMDETYETFFRATPPARSVVEVARLPRGALIEISVIAGR